MPAVPAKKHSQTRTSTTECTTVASNTTTRSRERDESLHPLFLHTTTTPSPLGRYHHSAGQATSWLPQSCPSTLSSGYFPVINLTSFLLMPFFPLIASARVAWPSRDSAQRHSDANACSSLTDIRSKSPTTLRRPILHLTCDLPWRSKSAYNIASAGPAFQHLNLNEPQKDHFYWYMHRCLSASTSSINQSSSHSHGQFYPLYTIQPNLPFTSIHPNTDIARCGVVISSLRPRRDLARHAGTVDRDVKTQSIRTVWRKVNCHCPAINNAPERGLIRTYHGQGVNRLVLHIVPREGEQRAFKSAR